jgi:hypothetical protein
MFIIRTTYTCRLELEYHDNNEGLQYVQIKYRKASIIRPRRVFKHGTGTRDPAFNRSRHIFHCTTISNQNI